MNSSAAKSKTSPWNALGGLGFFEEDFEKESSAIRRGAGEILEALIDLGQTAAGTETKSESKNESKFSMNGSISFKEQQAQIAELQTQQEKQQEEQKNKDYKRNFLQALKEDMDRAQKAKDKLLFEEEINDIATNLPTEQKNELLHYQASYRDRSIYQRAELRRKLIEQMSKKEKQEKAAAIPSPAKQPSAMEGAFEGRSGAQGGGTANLSAQAVG